MNDLEIKSIYKSQDDGLDVEFAPKTQVSAIIDEEANQPLRDTINQLKNANKNTFYGIEEVQVFLPGVTDKDCIVIYDTWNNKFVFKVGNNYYLKHKILSPAYNNDKLNTIIQNKVFIYNEIFYIYDKKTGGLLALNDKKEQFLTEREYNNLQKKDPDVIYYIYEEIAE